MKTVKTSLIKIAAVIGMLQGIAWTILGLVSFIVYFVQPELDLDDKNPSYNDIIKSVLYVQFIYSPDHPSGISYTSPFCKDCIVDPEVFLGFMIVVIIFNLSWAICSQLVYKHVSHSEKNQSHSVEKWMKNWSCITFIVLMWDLIVFFILLSDYHSKCKDNEMAIAIDNDYCHLSTGIAMTIAARGFGVLAVNGAFAVALFKFSRQPKSPRNQPQYQTPQPFYPGHVAAAELPVNNTSRFALPRAQQGPGPLEPPMRSPGPPTNYNYNNYNNMPNPPMDSNYRNPNPYSSGRNLY